MNLIVLILDRYWLFCQYIIFNKIKKAFLNKRRLWVCDTIITFLLDNITYLMLNNAGQHKESEILFNRAKVVIPYGVNSPVRF